MSKVILISQVPLPFSEIGSWTTLYANYLTNQHQIDCIICKQPEVLFSGVHYQIVSDSLFLRAQKKILKKPYLGYLQSLEKVLVTNEKYIIQIVDNFGIVKPLIDFLIKEKRREQCFIQFFYHGFPPFYGNFDSRFFFESIDEMILLTHDSYKVHKDYYTILPTRFSVLYNGIDTTKFHSVSREKKLEMKKSNDVRDKKVFVWCSQDRPKKGLHLILDVWQRVYSVRKDIVLWVIGCEPRISQEGVQYLGKIPNDELAFYFQASDCYLFPTLCHEGFGMSLIEALHCGNYCIASAIGGIPEVLQYGKLGKLIENPHFVSEWEKAILDFIENPVSKEAISGDLYSSKKWNLEMNAIIDNIKKTF